MSGMSEIFAIATLHRRRVRLAGEIEAIERIAMPPRLTLARPEGGLVRRVAVAPETGSGFTVTGQADACSSSPRQRGPKAHGSPLSRG
jgi:hypothetical protein